MNCKPAGGRKKLNWQVLADKPCLCYLAYPTWWDARIVFADTTYRVQPGDTLSGIAARYSTSVDAIWANNLLNRSHIYAGQTLTIPTGGSEPSAGPPTRHQAPIRSTRR